jgi:hypothetical protein
MEAVFFWLSYNKVSFYFFLKDAFGDPLSVQATESGQTAKLYNSAKPKAKHLTVMEWNNKERLGAPHWLLFVFSPGRGHKLADSNNGP